METFPILCNNFSVEIDGEIITSIPNLKIEQASLTQIIGSNGSGKTSFIESCAAIIPHVSGGKVYGEFKIFNSDLKETKTEQLRELVAYIPSAVDLFFACATLFEELSFTIAGTFPNLKTSQIYTRAHEIAVENNLTEIEHKNISDLSFGQRAKCAVICAISSRPSLLLMDEVMSSLDHENRQVIEKLIHEFIADGGSCIVADHDFNWKSDFQYRIETSRTSFELGHEPDVDIREWSRKSGTLCAITGANGSGKTTLLRHFAGFVKAEDLHPDNERLSQEIQNKFGVVPFSKKNKDNISYMPQECRHMFRFTTVEQELIIGSTTQRDNFIEKLDIKHVFDRDPKSLSYGEQKKLGIAIAFSSDPQTILLDEPTRGLDEISRQQVIRFIIEQSFIRDINVMCATHDQSLISACDFKFEQSSKNENLRDMASI